MLNMKQLMYICSLHIVLFVNCVRNLSSKKCEGNKGGCCDGFMFNETIGKCIECRVGYIGANCSEPCPYNSYGKGCQMTCNCIQDDCDFVLGCKKDKPEIYSQLHPFCLRWGNRP
ncbi:scavenger receptor class F member 2-like [Crassostrea virginica]